ncbi:hypothetical protein N9J72_00260 [Candidatus Gracilibacteria bacterium]|nr:hypothetical protein [Candidatus Gracilibacteria bacterium]
MKRLKKLFSVFSSTRFWVLFFSATAILIAYTYGQKIPNYWGILIIFQLIIVFLIVSKVSFNSFDVINSDDYLKDIKKDHYVSNFTVATFLIIFFESQNILSLSILLLNYGLAELDFLVSISGGAKKLEEIDRDRVGYYKDDS